MSKHNISILDTNILIRYLTNDTPKQAEAIRTLFQKAKEKSLMIPDIVLVEVVYVLLSHYELGKEEIIQKITILLTFEKFNLNSKLFQKTIELYTNHSISFVDAYLIALSVFEEATLYTFDKKLLSLSEGLTKQPEK